MLVTAVLGAAVCLCALSLAPAEALPPDSCGVPDALRAAGESERARKDYVRLLRQDPTLQCAQSGLALINSPAPSNAGEEGQQLCDRGDSLRAVHRDADAVAAYKSALEKDPELPCAIEGLEKAGPSRAGRWVDNAIAALPQYAFVAAVLIGLFFLFLLTGYSNPMYGWLVRQPLIGRILGPRVNLAALDDQSSKKVGPTIDALIKEKLVRTREDVDRANAPDYE